MNEVVLREGGEVPALQYAEFGETYLKFREDTPYEAWEFIFTRLQGAEKSLRWWIGDAIRFGERKYGEMYAQAVEATPYTYGTLANSKYVADKVPFSLRSENLGFSHHQAVAALEPAEQQEVLSQAAAEGWTERQTKEAAKDIRAKPPGGEANAEAMSEDDQTQEQQREGAGYEIEKVVRTAAQEYVVEYGDGTRHTVTRSVLLGAGWRKCPHCGGHGIEKRG